MPLITNQLMLLGPKDEMNIKPITGGVALIDVEITSFSEP